MKIVITGGHHSSALPVIKKLKELYPQTKIFWFGHKFSALGDKNPTLEYYEITGLGIPFYHIHAGKFYRTYNIKRLIKIPYGFFQCLFLLIKIKPHVILSFGGYIAVPTALAGWCLGIPIITHEQTVVAGWGNRLVAKVAKKVLISWKESEKYFPKGKTFFVGLPLRQEVFKAASNNFVFNNNLPIVYVTTGKIGSHTINQVIKSCLSDLLKICNVIHQTGDNSVYEDFDDLNLAYSKILQAKEPKGQYILRKFIFEDEIGEAYAKSDLVISRSGAHTTAELLALKKRCILIPIPWVSHNEQYQNAMLLVNAGLGSILSEKELSAESLLKHVKSLLSLPKINTTSEYKMEIAQPAQKIVEHIMEVCKMCE